MMQFEKALCERLLVIQFEKLCVRLLVIQFESFCVRDLSQRFPEILGFGMCRAYA